MPRKKSVPKFKYTTRKSGVLYVKYPLAGLKNSVWRICREETQTAVDEIIEEIKSDRVRTLAASEVPENCRNFFEFCLNRLKSRAAQRTLEKYETNIRLYLNPAIGDLLLSEVKAKHLDDIYDGLSERKLAPLTVRKVHSVASALFSEAVKLDLIPANPVKRASPPPITDNLKIKVVSPQKVQDFLRACKSSDYGIIFEFALESGLRPQEYLALRWSDLDLKKGAVEITRALIYDRKGGGFYFKEPKTRRSRRTVPLSKQMCDKLHTHQAKQNEYLAEVETRIHRSCKPSRLERREYNKIVIKNHAELNLVFASQDGTPLKDINIGRRYLKPIVKKAGLSSDLSLYSLRHTCCTLLLQAGVNIKVVSERMGHSNVSTVLNFYSHVLPGMGEQATSVLSAILYEEKT